MPHVHVLTDSIPLANGRVSLLGAARQVTGAATVVEQDGVRVLVDCGLAQGRDAQAPRWDRLGKLDAVVLTHGHLDHIGGLPELFDRGLHAPIYATAATLEIAHLSLHDSLRLSRVDAGRARDTLALLRERGKPVAYDQEVRIGATRLHLREAGHILGSASAELNGRSSRVVISGDLGRPNSPILRDYNTAWTDERPVDLAVIETTYGGRDHESNSEEIFATLTRVLDRALERRGKVFVPAFAIGRTQVLLYYIDRLVESGRIRDLPVVVNTPMGLSVTETYQRYRKLYDREALAKLAVGDDPLDFDNLFSVQTANESRRVEDLPGPMLVIAGSGMCQGGRIIHHLQSGLPDPNNTLLFVGYQAAGTQGAAILRAARAGQPEVRLNGQRVALRAQVEVLRGMSAHADRGELQRWLGALPRLGAVATHHGEPEAQRAFAESLQLP